jgi:glycosyltransferase involved in cell wall biosynthesis
LKILQVNASYKPAFIYGGPTMSVSKLSEQLLIAGVEIEVFTTTANGTHELNVQPGKLIVLDGVPVTYFRRLTKDHSHFSPRLLQFLFNNAKNFDVIHIHAWWNLVSVLAALISNVRGVKTLVSPRGTLSAYSFGNRNGLAKQLIHFFMGRRLLNKVFCHATTAAESEALKQILNPKKIFTIPNFVQLPAVTYAAKETPVAVFKLLFFSRIEEKKGLDILLNALPLLNFPYHLTIAGSGNQLYIDHLRGIATANLVSGNISWIGFQDENKFDVLYGHDLFILASHDENFGNTVIESLSVGTPVLISRQVGLADYVIQHKLGWVCNNDSESLSQTINHIAAEGIEDIARINQSSPQIISTDFEADALVKKYVAMYQEIILS